MENTSKLFNLLLLKNSIDIKSVFKFLKDSTHINKIPCKLNCNICHQNSLYCLNDYDHGQWLYCSNCNFAGYPIKYLKILSGRDLAELVNDMVRRNYIHFYIKKLQNINFKYFSKIVDTPGYRYERLWQEVSPPGTESDLQFRETIVPASTLIDPSRWIGTMSRYMGVIPVEKLRHLFKTVINKPVLNYTNLMDTAQSRFPLIVKFQDMPGRVSAILTVTSNHLFQLSAINAIYEYYPKNFVYKDVGVGFYETPFQYNKVFGDVAFATFNAKLACRLHAKWFEERRGYLPLILLDKRGDLTTLRSMPVKDWVLLSEDNSSHVLKSAAMLNARIANHGNISSRHLNKYIIWLNSMIEGSQHWTKSLYSLFNQLTDAEKQSFYSECKNNNRILFQIKNSTDKETYNRLINVDNEYHLANHVNYHTLTCLDENSSISHQFVETEDGWFHNNIRISDTVLHILKYTSVRFKTKNKIYVRCQLMRNGLIHKFNTKLSYLINNCKSIIIEHSILGGLGPPEIHPDWSNKLYDVARSFSDPTTSHKKNIITTEDEIKPESMY